MLALLYATDRDRPTGFSYSAGSVDLLSRPLGRAYAL